MLGSMNGDSLLVNAQLTLAIRIGRTERSGIVDGGKLVGKSQTCPSGCGEPEGFSSRRGKSPPLSGARSG
jgi:hypothetical protein